MHRSILKYLEQELPNFDLGDTSSPREMIGTINKLYVFDSAPVPYCLRVRTNHRDFAYEQSLVKEAVVAKFLTTFSPKQTAASQLSCCVSAQSEKQSGKLIINPLGPKILAYDQSLLVCPHPWSAQVWVQGHPIDSTDGLTAYRELGTTIGTLHQAKFDSFAPTLTEAYQPIDNWFEIRRKEIHSLFKKTNLDSSRLNELLGAFNLGKNQLVLTHNDLQPLNILFSGSEITLLDWDNAQIAPKELDFAKLRYWTARDNNGFLSPDINKYQAAVRSYHESTGENICNNTLAFCELLWLLRVWNFERKRESSGKAIGKPFRPSNYYLEHISRLLGC